MEIIVRGKAETQNDVARLLYAKNKALIAELDAAEAEIKRLRMLEKAHRRERMKIYSQVLSGYGGDDMRERTMMYILSGLIGMVDRKSVV